MQHHILVTADTVGPPFVLAQVHVQPREEITAQSVVGGVEWNDIAPRIDGQELSPEDARLRRAGAVDQQDLGGCRTWRRSSESLHTLRHACRSPVAEALFKQWLDVGERPV